VVRPLGANHVYGTGAVLPALCRPAACATTGVGARASSGSTGVQNADGGFGEDLRSYATRVARPRATRPRRRLRGRCSRYDAGGARGRRRTRAIGYLVETQRPGGGWTSPTTPAPAFPGDFYLNYHLYRDVFP
jgi:squalene-hopene/tetraprenyl-beta-curcumene cyclase